MRFTVSVFIIFLLFGRDAQAQNGLYFPPNGGTVWENLPPDSLNWCPDRIAAFYDFLDSTHAKAFMVLKDGKIVLEAYFDSFTMDSIWYWASAAKTLTATLVGIAQEEGLLSIDDPVSQYLGEGWTNCSVDDEAERTLFHQLTMSSGFNTNPFLWNCTAPTCFNCEVPPGSQWHYHNGVYRRLIEVVEQASGLTRNEYTTQKVRNPTGMDGFWIDNLYYSTPRAMARFGLLALNDFQWNGTVVLNDPVYINDMRTTALPANPAYGYLWWLNGQEHYYAPLNFTQQEGWLVPTAPADMYAGMGANEQRVYIVPSENLVVIRMGDAAYEGGDAAISAWDTELWQHLSNLECAPLSIGDASERSAFKVFPNPARGSLHLQSEEPLRLVRIFDLGGRLVKQVEGPALNAPVALPAGMYVIEAHTRKGDLYKAKAVVL